MNTTKPKLQEVKTKGLGHCHYGEIRIGYHKREWHVFVGGKHFGSSKDKKFLVQRSDPWILNDDYEREAIETAMQEEYDRDPGSPYSWKPLPNCNPYCE